MRNRKRLYFLTIISIIILVFTVLLSGCQLAKETGDMNRYMEKLCGVFVTIGSDALQSNQKALENVKFTINKKGEPVFKEEKWTSLYHNIFEGQLIDEHIIFDSIDGYYMGLFHTEDAKGEKYNANTADRGFYDSKFSVFLTDEGEEHKCEATLSVGSIFSDIININPVYQRGDGTFYTIIGQNMGFLITGDSSGQLYSQTLDSTITQAEYGNTHTDKYSFKVNIAVLDEVKQLVIKEMDQNDELIKTTEYIQDDPDEFKVDGKTKYVIVEEHLNNVMDGTYLKRSIYSFDKRNENTNLLHTCNFQEENGLMGMKSLKFVY